MNEWTWDRVINGSAYRFHMDLGATRARGHRMVNEQRVGMTHECTPLDELCDVSTLQAMRLVELILLPRLMDDERHDYIAALRARFKAPRP